MFIYKMRILEKIIGLLFGFKFENGQLSIFDDTELFKDE